uniref:Uncharacterized protein n=1 Tax=Oncorhynchus mykiss TaxID=8022 RepID=A0A8K9WSI5_ONCMY
MGRNMKNVCVSCGLLLILNSEGMGVASVSIAYSCIILSSRFLTPSLIRSLGCKWTIVAGEPDLSVIICLGGSPLWSAASTYLTTTVNHYFGIFFLLYQLSSVWGNLMSSLIFGQDTILGSSSAVIVNSTRPDDKSVNTMSGCSEISTVYSAGVNPLAVILVAAFLDNINSKHKLDSKGNKAPLCTVGFLTGDYTSVTSLFSILFVKLSQYIGREALFHLVRGDNLPVLFVFPALWGNADAVWQTQIKAFYGVIFYDQKEVAFANYRLWESVGFVALHPVWSSTCGSCTP